MEREEVTLRRDCEGTVIPYGEKVPLKTGNIVWITQALGGSYTVMTEHGYMVRVEGKDADALGKEAAAPEATETADSSLADRVWGQLRTCYDPEIPVNIVDLGLVYSVTVTPVDGEEGQNNVAVRFTLTAPGCGMGDALRIDIEGKIRALPSVKEADVQVAFEPMWNQSMMSDAARLQLGLM